MRPVSVYLDSSDFSMLTNPAGLDNNQRVAAEKLRNWISTGIVTCHFSGTHISEMAPLNSQSVRNSQCRASILGELCGKNALLSQDQLFIVELRRMLATDAACPNVNVFMPDGNWLPARPEDASPLKEIESLDLIASATDGAKNREERRALNRNLIKNGKIRTSARTMFLAEAKKASIESIVGAYPLRRKTIDVFMRYAINEASKEEAFNAYLEDLLDPKWMMNWFENNHDLMSPFIDWTRKPAAMVIRILTKIAGRVRLDNSRNANNSSNGGNQNILTPHWGKLQDQILVDFALHLCNSELGVTNEELTAEQVDKCCPALSTAIRSMHSAFRTATVQQRPRRPRLSDYTDAMHAAYAPYVDVFRADSFMAPHIKANAEKYGAHIVPKFSALPIAIEEMLAKNGCTRP